MRDARQLLPSCCIYLLKRPNLQVLSLFCTSNLDAQSDDFLLTGSELTDVFFSMTKLFQSQDVIIERVCYHIVIEGYPIGSSPKIGVCFDKGTPGQTVLKHPFFILSWEK